MTDASRPLPALLMPRNIWKVTFSRVGSCKKGNHKICIPQRQAASLAVPCLFMGLTEGQTDVIRDFEGTLVSTNVQASGSVKVTDKLSKLNRTLERFKHTVIKISVIALRLHECNFRYLNALLLRSVHRAISSLNTQYWYRK